MRKRAGGVQARMQKVLLRRLEALNNLNSASTVDEIIEHLLSNYPEYKRKKRHALIKLVQDSLDPALLCTRRIMTKQTQSSAEENDSSSADDDDGVVREQGEKVEPQYDVAKSMLRESYVGSHRKRQARSISPPRKKYKRCVDHEEDTQWEENSCSNDKYGALMSEPRRASHAGSRSKKDNKETNLELEPDVCGSDEISFVKLGKEGKGKPMFKDLGGMNKVLEQLDKDMLVLFHHCDVLEYCLGVQLMSGLLLHGPPGCGKTKLAHAIANETGFPFYKISATELVSSISGESEENIRQLFQKAYKTAPSIISIDEIDAIASKRENLQRETDRRIVMQLMACMDAHSESIESSDNGQGYVLVIGATNRPNVLDPALRRRGRFDYEIELDVPDENARSEILTVLARTKRLEGCVELLKIARSTPGFVAADLEALVDKAGYLAVWRMLDQRKSKLGRNSTDEEQSKEYLKTPATREEKKNICITTADLEKAIKMVQPSTTREGFSAIPEVKWEDVGGLDLLRKELDLHIVRRIKYPEKYEKLGVDLEMGFLLYGPPGCGKTLIAKAVANEAGANFIHIKGPELLNKYVGESELAVRTLFSRARKCSPCIIFFDEVDALTANRGKEGEAVTERLTKQLLIELDGGDQRRGVFVIGATNKPEVMDDALMRPGRFGNRLYVPLPTPDQRGLILKALTKKKSLDANVDLNAIGRMEACDHFSGADLVELVYKASIIALNDDLTETIKTTHFEQALTEISPSVTPRQRRHYRRLARRLKAAT